MHSIQKQQETQGFREWGFFELMADPGLIIAFAHGLLAACSPAQG